MELVDAPRRHHGTHASPEGRGLHTEGDPLPGAVVTEAESPPVGLHGEQRLAVDGDGDGAREVAVVGKGSLRDPRDHSTVVEYQDPCTVGVGPGRSTVPQRRGRSAAHEEKLEALDWGIVVDEEALGGVGTLDKGPAILLGDGRLPVVRQRLPGGWPPIPAARDSSEQENEAGAQAPASSHRCHLMHRPHCHYCCIEMLSMRIVFRPPRSMTFPVTVTVCSA